MKKFVFNIILFCLPFLAVSYFLDVFISNHLKNSTIHGHKEYSVWKDIFEGKINSEILIYGSSRAWVHINPTMISDSLGKSTYNMGIDGHNFLLQYLRHKLYLKYNPKPKVIILSLDPFSLQKHEDLYNADQFLPYMLWNQDIKDFILDYNGFKAIDFEIPLVRYYGNSTAIKAALLTIISPNTNIPNRIKGYQAQDTVWNNDFEKAKKTLGFYTAIIDKKTFQLFEKFIQECKDSSIQLIFVYTPDYIEGQSFIKNRSEVRQIYTTMSQKYNIPYFDYANDSISYNKDYFYNSMHLNKKGSELFTKKFIGNLKGMENKLFYLYDYGQ